MGANVSDECSPLAVLSRIRDDTLGIDYSALPDKKSGIQAVSWMTADSIEILFDKAWEYDPEGTLKLVFYMRDTKHIGSRKRLFRIIIRHMREKGLEKHILQNLHLIPKFGTWKDLLLMFVGTSLENATLTLFARQLQEDMRSEIPSLCAKHAPSEGGALDKRYRIVATLAKLLHCSKEQYRKLYLSPLRERLDIVERKMCAKEYDKITTCNIKSRRIYACAFAKNEVSLESDTEKDMTFELMNFDQITATEHMWKKFINNYVPPNNIRAIAVPDLCNYSLSSFSNIILTLTSIMTQFNNDHIFIPVHEHPQLVTIPDVPSCDRLNIIRDSPWGFEINYQGILELILQHAITNKLSPEEIVNTILIMTRHEFSQLPSLDNIKEKYHQQGYQLPHLVYWNIIFDSAIKVTAPNPYVTIITGHDGRVHRMLLKGVLPTPEETVRCKINDKRYDEIKLAT